MIVIAGKGHVKADKRDDAIQALVAMQTATHEENGCIAYTFSLDLEDDTLIHLFEEWESAEALAAHSKTPHMATFRQQLPDLMASKLDIKRYEIANASNM